MQQSIHDLNTSALINSDSGGPPPLNDGHYLNDLDKLYLDRLFHDQDEWEKQNPLQQPKYHVLPDDEAYNFRRLAIWEDYTLRLERYKERVKEYRAHQQQNGSNATSQSLPDSSHNEMAFNEAVAQSRRKAEEYFPSSLQPQAPINAKATEIWNTLRTQQNPLIHDANAPFIVYSMAAAQLGIKPAK